MTTKQLERQIAAVLRHYPDAVVSSDNQRISVPTVAGLWLVAEYCRYEDAWEGGLALDPESPYRWEKLVFTSTPLAALKHVVDGARLKKADMQNRLWYKLLQATGEVE